MDALAFSWLQGLGSTVDVHVAGSSQPQTMESFTTFATALTASKSPGEAIGKPASITSHPYPRAFSPLVTFLQGSWNSRRLLPVTQGGIKDYNPVRVRIDVGTHYNSPLFNLEPPKFIWDNP